MWLQVLDDLEVLTFASVTAAASRVTAEVDLLANISCIIGGSQSCISKAYTCSLALAQTAWSASGAMEAGRQR